ncbi:amidohydrolase family protein [Ornithinimicrobium pratense]|uniref:Amidohydrolase family protein n=1 Tax=Ornithinimicrobium pratense TaxID=2593973 RepID=A0A5J6V6T8_9MICO|nr:amidohydrolase family protein [Ornithinimicrobium pratense]QFG69495.1 amidohydrolase family protein [Ornithinimicrobium pratense]
MTDQSCDTLISGGRLVDPENEIDAQLNVGMTGGRITYVGSDLPEAATVIDATGKLVVPGFIDLHSHAQNLTGHRLQAFDGVTTSLELESGATPVQASLAWAAAQGRPLHYGFSAGWLHARIIVLEELDDDTVAAWPPLPLDSWSTLQDRARWRQAATTDQIARIVDLVKEQLEAGALGIGMLLGYASATSSEELYAIAELAVRRGCPLFVHMRGLRSEDDSPATAVRELIGLSRDTGVQVHLCHFVSSSAASVQESAALLAEAVAEGLPVTTESYPYGIASTVLGAEFLHPDRLASSGLSPTSITVIQSGEQVATLDRLVELRTLDPGALCAIRYYDEDDPARSQDLKEALVLAGAAFASDAMPVQSLSGPGDDEHGRTGDATELDEWPVPNGYTVHPRSLACFTRAISWLHRDTGLLSLSEVITRCSVIPARILRPALPAMTAKGHLAVGADADVVVINLGELDPHTEFAPVRATHGITDVFVAGTPLIQDGELCAARPGRPLLAPPTSDGERNTS